MAYIIVRLLRSDIKLLRRTCADFSPRNPSEYIFRLSSSDSAEEGEKDLLDVQNDEETIMAARDVSRMPKRYRDQMKHVMNPPELLDWYADMFQRIEQKRMIYAKYGRKSGLDPGILWPTKEEIKEQIEFEKEWEPSLEEMLKSLKEDRLRTEKDRQMKQQTVMKQMARMPQLIKDFYDKQEKKAEQERQQEAKKRELLEEARDYFGYSIDPRDPRFEEMQLRKEEEEKMVKKKKKKEAKALLVAKGLIEPR